MELELEKREERAEKDENMEKLRKFMRERERYKVWRKGSKDIDFVTSRAK